MRKHEAATQQQFGRYQLLLRAPNRNPNPNPNPRYQLLLRGRPDVMPLSPILSVEESRALVRSPDLENMLLVPAFENYGSEDRSIGRHIGINDRVALGGRHAVLATSELLQVMPPLPMYALWAVMPWNYFRLLGTLKCSS